MTKQRPGTNKE